jgi:thiamine biosynthesis lipoprotein
MSADFSFDALATKWWIKIYDKKVDLEQIFNQIETLSKDFEKSYSRFLDESYISKLNRNKSLSHFPHELYQILVYSENIRQKSAGLFNVAVGGILENLGYDKNYSFSLKQDIESISVLDDSSFETLDENLIQIRPDAKIDLGGIGKGWLIDKIAKFLSDFDIKYFSINGGGDIYATTDQDNPISFVLEHPKDFTQKIGSISIANQGIACSAPNRRMWIDQQSDQTFHHLIDIQNSNSAMGKLAVFTQGKNATIADVMSTVIFVAKNEEIEDLAKLFEVEFLIIFPDLSFVKSLGYKGILNA